MIHRDFSPTSVLLDMSGRARITGLGNMHRMKVEGGSRRPARSVVGSRR